jgi:hypothetical protein
MKRANSIRAALRERTIRLDKLDDDTGIFDQVDAFVNHSRDNQTVTEVVLRLAPDPDAHRYAIWDKIAEGIGNLQALRSITIVNSRVSDGHGDPLAPDWEILACILRRLRHSIHLRLQDAVLLFWDPESVQIFAGSIRGNAMIESFSTGTAFAFDCFDNLCSALLTLPALEIVSVAHDDDEGPEEGQSLESMVKLLRSPTLRKVEFAAVDFTNTLSRAVAKALEEKSEITILHFDGCSFPEGGSAVIARALKTNTTVKDLYYDNACDELFCEVLAAALLSNCTLENLTLSAPEGSGSCSWLVPLFLALQVNSGLKELCIDGIHLIDEKLSTAMMHGLSNNSTLETLKLSDIKSGDNDICLWRKALSFLPTNTALKTLHMQFDEDVTESRVATIRMEVLTVLCENECQNESLETLEMISEYAGIKEYLECIEAIQSNATLKKLQLMHEEMQDFFVDQDDFIDVLPVLKKNYGLEEIPEFPSGAGDIRSILDLNRAGRRYLVQDGSSIPKGVAVLSHVKDDINSVFLHLLENPRLCDRSAVEMSSSSIANMDNDGSTSPGDRHSGDKREPQAPSQPGKETRRRLK